MYVSSSLVYYIEFPKIEVSEHHMYAHFKNAWLISALVPVLYGWNNDWVLKFASLAKYSYEEVWIFMVYSEVFHLRPVLNFSLWDLAFFKFEFVWKRFSKRYFRFLSTMIACLVPRQWFKQRPEEKNLYE